MTTSSPFSGKRWLLPVLIIAGLLAVVAAVALAITGRGATPKPSPAASPTHTAAAPTPTPTPPAPHAPVSIPSSLISQGIDMGTFAPPSPNIKDGMNSIIAVESTLGSRMDVVNWFTKFADEYGQFTTDPSHTTAQMQLQEASSDGRLPMVTWEPWAHGDTATSSSYNMADIASGKYDDYLHSWARGMAAFNKPVYLRFAHEMNGNWYPWSSNAGGPADYVAGWRHVHDLFVNDGATNVKWVWAPAQKDFSAPLEQYWPGADYVDVLGSSLYNCHSDGWEPFQTLLQPVYDRLAALDASKPIWVTELGTCDPLADATSYPNQSRPDWYVSMLDATTFPRLTTIVLFDAIGNEDWQIKDGTDSATALRNSLAQSTSWTAPPQGTTYGPSLPAATGMTASRDTKTSAALTWQAVDSAQGYKITRNGTTIAFTLGTTWADPVIDDTVAYTYTVSPVNAGTSGAATSASITAVPVGGRATH